MSFRNRSSSVFLDHVDGSFGQRLLCLYIQKLDNFGATQLFDMRKEALVGCIMVMGEIWRRFVLERKCFPFRLWELVAKKSNEEFLLLYREFQQMKKDCPECCDAEFSYPILTMIAEVDTETAVVTQQKISAIRSLLHDLSIYSPLSSDVVECLHGFSQAKCHRYRGCKPSDSAAQQLTLWASIISSYKQFRSYMWQRLGDFKVNFRLHRFDRQGSNQWSDTKEQQRSKYKKGATASVWSKKENLGKIARASTGFVRTPRALSGSLFVLHCKSFLLLLRSFID